MKKIIFVLVLLINGSVVAQQETPLTEAEKFFQSRSAGDLIYIGRLLNEKTALEAQIKALVKALGEEKAKSGTASSAVEK